MQTTNTTTVFQARANDVQKSVAKPPGNTEHSVNAMTLARLDIGLFKSLCTLGTSRERICSVLGISQSDFEYIRGLAGIPIPG